MRAPRPAIAAILLASLLIDAASAGDLSKSGERLVKLTHLMGRRKRPRASDERKFAALLDSVPAEELATVLERVRQPDATDVTDALRALIVRIEERELAFRYPGASDLPDFAELLASEASADRARLLRKLLSIENLAPARTLALEWADLGAESLEPTLTAIDVIDRLIGLGETEPELVATLQRALAESKHPAVRCVAARGLETADRPEVIAAYLAGLDDTEEETGFDPDAERGTTRTFSFGARAWYRLAELSGLHPATDHDEYLRLKPSERAAWRAELAAWWKKSESTFRFHRSRWERFALEPVVFSAVVALDEPGEAVFTFRAPSDRALVKLELASIDFVDSEERWRPFGSWTLSYGIGGSRNALDEVSGKHVRVGRRTGGAKAGIAWIDVAVQRIGLDRVRIVVRYADFLEKLSR